MPKHLDPDAMPPWLASLWPKTRQNQSIIAGIDEDDCAVVRLDQSLLVITVDYLNARPIAVQLGIGGLYDLGRLVVAITVSDLCGSGAMPTALLTGITMEREASEEDFKSLMLGVQQEANKWGIPVIGGDTKLGNARALLSVGLGTAESEANLFLKTRGEPGQLLWCSGQLGSCNAAALGLKESSFSPEWNEWAKNAVLVPNIPIYKSRSLSVEKLGIAGIDISDGLGADLHRMCKGSNVGAIINAEAIPVHPNAKELAQELGVPPWAFAFCGGGDFQFLVTSEKSAAPRVSELGFHLIGELTEEQRLVLDIGNQRIPLPDAGHRDARQMTFLDEISTLLSGLMKASSKMK